MGRQYVACIFNDGGRSYTYHFDGDTVLKKGDYVKADPKPGEEHKGWQRLKVVSIVGMAPSFPTKPVHAMTAEELAQPSSRFKDTQPRKLTDDDEVDF